MAGARTVLSNVNITAGKMSPYGDYSAWMGASRCPNGDLLYMAAIGADESTATDGVTNITAWFRSQDQGATWSRQNNQFGVGCGINKNGLEEAWLGYFTDVNGTFMLATANANVGFSFSNPAPHWYQQNWSSVSTDNGHTWDPATLVYFYHADGSLWKIVGRDGQDGTADEDLEMTGGWIQLPDGSLICPLGVVPTSGFDGIARNSGYTVVARSTDRGKTWREYGSAPWPAQSGWMYLEGSFIRLPSGRIASVVRVKENPLNGYLDYTSWVCYSDDNAQSWYGHRRLWRAVASRDMSVIGPEGDWVVGIRSVTPAEASGPTVWMQSWDEGATWTSPVQVPAGAGISAYGQGVNVLDTPGVDGNIAIMYQEEGYGGSGWSGQGSDAYFLKFTKPAGWVPTTPLVLASGNSVWSQSGTSVTLNHAPSGVRSTVAATVYSTQGGLVRFLGADASRFSVSADGTTWSDRLQIASGSRTIYLGVTPQAGDAALAATVGIPA